MTRFDSGRRKLLKASGAALTIAIAGCSGGDDGGNGNGNGNGNGGGGVPGEVDDYLSDANGYDGSAEDLTGESEVTVEVGTGSNGFAFSPAAIRVDTGTTVVWEWTGNGGGHNVVAEDETFSSGDEYVSEAGHTYEYTFEDSGNFNYYCTPHQSAGMLAAVIVE